MKVIGYAVRAYWKNGEFKGHMYTPENFESIRKAQDQERTYLAARDAGDGPMVVYLSAVCGEVPSQSPTPRRRDIA